MTGAKRAVGSTIASLWVLAACTHEAPQRTAAEQEAARIASLRLLGGTVTTADQRAAWSRLPIALNQLHALRSGAGVFVADHPGQCPTMLDLRRDGLSSIDRDAWGNPFTIECVGDEVRVCSNGPDGRLQTLDDSCDPRIARR